MTATSSSPLADAMRSIVDATALLRDFHREVVAFYGLVDSLLVENDIVSLEALDPNNVVRETAASMKNSQEWTSRWFGRFYYEPALWTGDEEGSGVPPTYEQLHTVFVYIAAAATDDELSDFKTPECLFGVGHVGRDAKVKTVFDGARYGLWNVDLKKAVGSDWTEGKTPERTGKFGTGGYWTLMRVPLVDLTSEAKIREIVTGPLKERYRERRTVA